MRILTILILSSFCMAGCLSAKNSMGIPSVSLSAETPAAGETAATSSQEEQPRFYYPVYINDSDNEKIKSLQESLLHRYGQRMGATGQQYYYPLNIVVN